MNDEEWESEYMEVWIVYEVTGGIPEIMFAGNEAAAKASGTRRVRAPAAAPRRNKSSASTSSVVMASNSGPAMAPPPAFAVPCDPTLGAHPSRDKDS